MTESDYARALAAAAEVERTAYTRRYGRASEGNTYSRGPIPPIAVALLRDIARHDHPVVIDARMADRLQVVTQTVSNALRIMEPRGLVHIERTGSNTKSPRVVTLTDEGRKYLERGC